MPVVLLLLFIILSMPAHAEIEPWIQARIGVPHVKKLDFGDKDRGSLPWSVVWDESGVAYIGRDRLWPWNGTRWSQHGPDDLKLMRALEFGPEGRLWAGGANSLGYFDPVTLNYTSVLDWFPVDHPLIGDVWNIHHDGQFLWVGTERRLYRINENTFHSWEFPGDHRVIFHFLESGVFAHVPLSGIWKVNGLDVILCRNDSFAERTALVYLNDNDDDSLVGITGNGIFSSTDSCESFLFWEEFSETLKGISSVSRLTDELYAVGTIGNGMFFLTHEERQINLTSLAGNVGNLIVLKLGISPDGLLWILNTRGISIFDPDLNDTGVVLNAELSSATIQSVSLGNPTSYIATTNGLYEYRNPSKESAFVTRINDWEIGRLVTSERGLLFDRYGEIYGLKEGFPAPFIHFDREICAFTVDNADRLIVSFHDRIEGYGPAGEGPPEKIWEEPTEAIISNLETDSGGRVWGWSDKTPLYEFPPDATGPVYHTIVAGKPLRTDPCLVGVTTSGPVLMFRDEIVRRDPDKGKWISSGHDIGLGIPLAQAYRREAGRLIGWLVYDDPETSTNQVVRVEWPDGGMVKWEQLPWLDMSGIGQIHKLQWSDDAEEELIFIGMRGLVVTSTGLSGKIPAPARPVIEGDSVERSAGEWSLEYFKAAPRVTFSSPGSAYYYPVRYQTRVLGYEDSWSEPARFTDREIGQLLEGRYRFEVRAVDPFGRTSAASGFAFRILPPWYRTVWAYSLGIGTVIVLLYGVMRLRENQLRDHQLELQVLVDERTEELLRANAFKDEFIANLSHEIRNPLNGVIGLIRQLKEGQSITGRNLEALRGAAHYLKATVEDVLDFSKLDSGQLELVEEPFDLGRIAAGVIDIYHEQAWPKGLVFEKDISIPAGISVVSDERKFQQILGNLIGNAVKFTQSGGVAVGVSLSPMSEEQAEVLVRVADTGEGIDPADQQLVFEKFYQSGTASRRAGGTGLGLTLVKAFTSALGGSIRLESELGKGSTFEVRINVRTKACGGMGPLEGHDLGNLGLSVLVVEDLEYNRIYLEECLQRLGCRVELAVDGITGYQLAGSGRYSVILLDWDLPGMTGLEIARKLRSDGSLTADTRVIGMTAFATPDVRRQCLEAGMDAFLTKPLDESQLQSLLLGMAPVQPRGAAVAAEAGEECYLTGQGILGEMAGADGWERQKERWMGIFEEYFGELRSVVEGTDLEDIRKAAHRLLGHLRMVRTDGIADHLLDMMTAATVGDLEGTRAAWSPFLAKVGKFRDEVARF